MLVLVCCNLLALLLLKRREQLSEAYRAELTPEVKDPLTMIENHQQDLRTFQQHLNMTRRHHERPGEAVRFLQPEKGLYNPLIAGFYEDSYPENTPAGDVLAYDIHTMWMMTHAAKNAFKVEGGRGVYSQLDAQLLPLLVNGRGDSGDYILNGHEVDSRRVRSGMCFGMRRVAAVITPLRIERTFY